MKKELFAGLTILCLLIISIAGYVHLAKLTDGIALHTNKAMSAVAQGNFVTAQTEMNTALKLWNNDEHYTHIFIRHSEVDAVSDAFYEVLEAICANQKSEAQISIQKLMYHINSVQSMEKITFKSVF